MVDIKTIKSFTTEIPNDWTIFGSEEEFDKLPDIHKAQILFLNKEASSFIYQYSNYSKLTSEDVSNPFAKGNFKTVDIFSNFSDNDEAKHELKKWLFNRQIPFKSWVFVLPNYNKYAILTTWKMVVKYSIDIFFSDDIEVFDETLN